MFNVKRINNNTADFLILLNSSLLVTAIYKVIRTCNVALIGNLMQCNVYLFNMMNSCNKES
jgi:hypothetical protein